MGVGGWDPGSHSLERVDVERLLRASRDLEAPDFGLSTDEIARLAPRVRQGSGNDWPAAAEPLASSDIERLIRLFTLAEMRFSAWEAGAKSPVVPLATILKNRGDFPRELSRWIRQHTTNRFLPHGSLLDRL